MQCLALGISPKLNALIRDSATQVMLKPTPGGGHAEIAQLAMSEGIATAWEHFYNGQSENETYWAMLTFIALGGTVVDLPEQHLDTLADIAGLWDWTLEMASYPLERVGLYVARDTETPAPGNGYEHGWPGAWSRNVTTNATCYAPKTDGRCAKDLTVTATLPDGEYEVEVVYAPDGDTDAWSRYLLTTMLPGTFTIPTGPCWVHRVVIVPYEPTEPVEPNEPTEPTEPSENETSLAELRDAVKSQEEEIKALWEYVVAHNTISADVTASLVVQAEMLEQMDARITALADLRTRLEEIERWRLAIADVTAVSP
jgi:hypothetical protein